MSLSAYKIKPKLIPQAAPALVPAAVPGATPGVLAAVPVMYPAGPTDLGFLYQQLQSAAFYATANTFTLKQKVAVTSPGETAGALELHITDSVDGTGDPTTIRPAALILQHDSTLPVVGGIGTGLFFQTLDANGTTVRIGKELAEITDGTPGACHSTMAWCCLKSGTEVEVFRIRGSQGMTPRFRTGGSVADGGGAAGKEGGQLYVRGDLYSVGDVFHQKFDSVNNLPLRVMTFEHTLTSGGPVTAGFGAEHYWQSQDASGNLVPMARQQVFLTAPSAGAVDTAMAWTCVKGSTEIEVARIQGSFGPAAIAGGGFTGFTGGRLLVSGDFAIIAKDAQTAAPLRLATYEHQSSGTVAAGFGTEHYWQTRDGSGNLVPAARDQVLVATATAGAVDTLRAWSISMAGQEIEVFRIQALGMAPANTGGITGWVGGRLLCQGEFRHTGAGLGFYGATTVARPDVTGSRGGNAALASLLAQLAALGLITDSTT